LPAATALNMQLNYYSYNTLFYQENSLLWRNNLILAFYFKKPNPAQKNKNYIVI